MGFFFFLRLKTRNFLLDFFFFFFFLFFSLKLNSTGLSRCANFYCRGFKKNLKYILYIYIYIFFFFFFFLGQVVHLNPQTIA